MGSLIERLIPSWQARKLYEAKGVEFSDFDMAALIWHSDLTLKEKEEKLFEIQNKTTNQVLKEQIFERLSYDLKCRNVFKNVSEGYVYEVRNYEFKDASTCLGYFGLYELAIKAGKQAEYDFFVKKHQIIYENTNPIKTRSIAAEFIQKEGEDTIEEQNSSDGVVAEYEFRADGEEKTFWSNELPIDALVRKIETLSNESFENKYVEIPNPFEEGDVVRDVLKGRKMVVVTSQSEWKVSVERAKQPNTIYDWSDASIVVVPEGRNMDFHNHINPILLEKIEEPYFTKGHDYGAAYWIWPVFVMVENNISNVKEEYIDKEISVEMIAFNRYFKKSFLRYFDAKLPANKYRFTKAYKDEGEYLKKFDEVLEHNFYTTKQILKIADEIDENYEDFKDFTESLRKMSSDCNENCLISVMGP